MSYTRPQIVSGQTKLNKAFFENVFDGIDETAPGGGSGPRRSFLGVLSSESRMLGDNTDALVGDWLHRSDLGTDWELIAQPPAQLGSWREYAGSADEIADGSIVKAKLSPALQASINKADWSQTAVQVQEIALAVIAAWVGQTPGALDTLEELAASLGNNPNFATDVMALIGTKVDSTDPRLSDARAPLNHSADKITSGFLNVGRGGIGRTDLPAERYLRGNGAGSVITDSYETVLANIGAAPKASPLFTGVAETPGLKITGGTPGVGKVWTGTDDTGAATWQAPASGGVTIDDESEDSQTKTWSAFKLYRDMLSKQDERVSFYDPDSGEYMYSMSISDWMSSVGESLDKFAVDASAGKVWTSKNSLGDGEWRTPTGGGGGMSGVVVELAGGAEPTIDGDGSGDQGGVAAGTGASVFNGGVAIGAGTKVTDGGFALGSYSEAKFGSMALGDGATAEHYRSVAVGRRAGTTADDQVMLGTGQQTVVAPNKLQIGPDGEMSATLSTRTNGGGATEIIIQFATGDPVVLATTPAGAP